VTVAVKKGAVVLWTRSIGNGDATGFSFDLAASVLQGEQIDFVIGGRAGNGCDATYFNPTIVLTGP
jgi:hypothetical protein